MLGLFPIYEARGEAEKLPLVKGPDTVMGRKDYSPESLPLKVKSRNQSA